MEMDAWHVSHHGLSARIIIGLSRSDLQLSTPARGAGAIQTVLPDPAERVYRVQVGIEGEGAFSLSFNDSAVTLAKGTRVPGGNVTLTRGALVTPVAWMRMNMIAVNVPLALLVTTQLALPTTYN